MKHYIGHRAGGKRTVVVIDRDASPASWPLKHWPHHSPNGFEWGFGGSGPADLALAILAEHFGEEPTGEAYDTIPPTLKCVRYYRAFKWAVVSGFGTAWELTSADIDAWRYTV